REGEGEEEKQEEEQQANAPAEPQTWLEWATRVLVLLQESEAFRERFGRASGDEGRGRPRKTAIVASDSDEEVLKEVVHDPMSTPPQSLKRGPRRPKKTSASVAKTAEDSDEEWQPPAKKGKGRPRKTPTPTALKSLHVKEMEEVEEREEGAEPEAKMEEDVTVVAVEGEETKEVEGEDIKLAPVLKEDEEYEEEEELPEEEGWMPDSTQAEEVTLPTEESDTASCKDNSQDGVFVVDHEEVVEESLSWIDE
ncbi:hypothetical protein PMAYCL1PPCAC_00224, partial [Pristionchus mayeri]